MAFLLNVAAVFLVGAGSGLVLTLAGVFKDILLITGSVLIFGNNITPLQVIGTSLHIYFHIHILTPLLLGYAIALAGLVLYRTAGSK